MEYSKILLIKSLGSDSDASDNGWMEKSLEYLKKERAESFFFVLSVRSFWREFRIWNRRHVRIGVFFLIHSSFVVSMTTWAYEQRAAWLSKENKEIIMRPILSYYGICQMGVTRNRRGIFECFCVIYWCYSISTCLF